MISLNLGYTSSRSAAMLRASLAALLLIFTTHFNTSAQNPVILPDSIPVGSPVTGEKAVVDNLVISRGDSLVLIPQDTVPVIDGPTAFLDSIVPGSKWDQEWVERKITYSPDPNRAVWMSALFPGLGQIYNRRYWKLPLIVGGYLGLGYATSWNNTMLKDYTRAYADITDNDPSTKSYLDFFPKNVDESKLDKQWLENVFKNRKNMYRRNRDLCVICMIGVYLLAMVDAYVDASLAHFDISPDLSINVFPAVIQESRNERPAFGLNWAINF